MVLRAAKGIVRFFRRGDDSRSQTFDGEGRWGAVVVCVGERVRRLRLLVLLASLFRGGAARGAFFQDDALAVAREGVGVAGAGREAGEELRFVLLERALFGGFFLPGGYAAEARLLFFEGLAGREGGGFLGLQGGVVGDGVGILGGVGGEGGFGGGEVDPVKEVEG